MAPARVGAIMGSHSGESKRKTEKSVSPDGSSPRQIPSRRRRDRTTPAIDSDGDRRLIALRFVSTNMDVGAACSTGWSALDQMERRTDFWNRIVAIDNEIRNRMDALLFAPEETELKALRERFKQLMLSRRRDANAIEKEAEPQNKNVLSSL